MVETPFEAVLRTIDEHQPVRVEIKLRLEQAQRRLKMSGRSYSAAWADFFPCHPAPVEEAPERANTTGHTDLVNSTRISRSVMSDFWPTRRRISAACASISAERRSPPSGPGATEPPPAPAPPGRTTPPRSPPPRVPASRPTAPSAYPLPSCQGNIGTPPCIAQGHKRLSQAEKRAR